MSGLGHADTGAHSCLASVDAGSVSQHCLRYPTFHAPSRGAQSPLSGRRRWPDSAMAKYSLKLARGRSGARPSRRTSVRMRTRTNAKKTKQPLMRPVHLAAKRAMRKVALRDCGQRCVYCATHLDQSTATLDHVVPVARGGAHDPGNVVVACGPCNRLKGDLLPFEFFARYPWAGANFVRYARSVHRALKRGARRAVSLAYAA